MSKLAHPRDCCSKSPDAINIGTTTNQFPGKIFLFFIARHIGDRDLKLRTEHLLVILKVLTLENQSMNTEPTAEQVEVLFSNIGKGLTAGELFLVCREIHLGHYMEAEKLLTSFAPGYSQIELQAWINDVVKQRNDWKRHNSK